MKTKTETSSVRSGTGVSLGLALRRVRIVLLASATAATMALAINAHADRVAHDVSAAYIAVEQSVPGYFNNTNAVAFPLVSVNGMQVVTNSAVPNMGDTRVMIGDVLEDDVSNGVLMVAIAQNGRANWTNGAGVMTNNFQTAAAIPYAGGYWEAGVFRCPPISATTANPGEDNVNIGVAYFPYSSYVGGVALNSANGGELTNFSGSAGLVLGTHFMDSLTNGAVSDPAMNGVYYLDLRSLGIDSRRDGVLLVNHAKNEANFALSRVNNDDDEMDGTWTLYTHDNRANGRTYEQDPVAFVFIPKSDTRLVSGMFMGDGAIAIHSGTTPAFIVAWRSDLGPGRYELKIPGRGPGDGVLIISAAGGDPFNGDNIVTYAPNAANDGWLIRSYDLPGIGNGQSPPENEPVCSFVFIPAETPGISLTPNQNNLTTESGGTAQFTVTVNGYPKPTADVSVNLSSSDTSEGTIDLSTLTFTAADWNVSKTVTITGVDDAISDGTQPYEIQVSNTSSSDANFNGLVVGNAGAINIDNEPGVSVDASKIITTEAGGTATFSVWLNTAPTADVTLALSSSDLTEADVSPSVLTFTPADYSTPQTVTVTGIDDDIQDGPVTYFVVTATASSADPAYNGFNALDIQGENQDNDIAKVIIPADVQTVSEPNTTTTFPVVLGTQPTVNVTVNFVASDATEVSVTPSVTFTPADWNTPKNVTVTAVNDTVNDGPITSTLITTVTSTDPVYATINPDDLTVVTLDNEAALVLSIAERVYGIGDPAMVIDGFATITDSDTGSYDGGNLTVSITTGGSSTDRLAVRNDGTGAGQIGVSGSTINYAGSAIGTVVANGTGTTPLTINLNSAATIEAVQALLRAITYQDVDISAAPQTKVLTLTFVDGVGGTSTVSVNLGVSVVRIYSYQQGADTGFGFYSGAGDCELDWERPDSVFPMGVGNFDTTLWVDWNTDDPLGIQQKQVLLRFTNIFGTGPGQIPPGAKIVDAKVYMNVTDSGHGARFNRMLMDWDADGTTFNGMGGVISTDDVEAVSGTNSFLGDQVHQTTTGGGYMYIGVTEDIRAWADGANNYGWVLSPWVDGANGTAFSPSEHTNVVVRPKLVVSWVPGSASVATFRQGENGYTGAMDTQIRLVDPANTAFATATSLAPDAAVAATPAVNPNQVLIRFDNLTGTAVGQIPQGSAIHAAVLEVTSITSDSQGNGAQIHALLQPWSDTTSTWNSWVDGIEANGIEAALTPSVTVPKEGQGATVQSTRHVIDLTSDVQKWVNGTLANNGWVLLPWPGGSNGWAFNSAEGNPLETRPQLRVYFEPGVLMMAPVIEGTSMKISFSGSEGKTYTVQRTTSLVGGWSNVGSAAVTGGIATYTDNAPPAGGAFYRVTW